MHSEIDLFLYVMKNEFVKYLINATLKLLSSISSLDNCQ